MVRAFNNLNRLITVSASSTETVFVPSLYYFEGFAGLGDSLTRDWAARNIGGDNTYNQANTLPPADAHEYEAVTEFRFPVNYISGDSPFQTPLPDLTQMSTGDFVRLYSPDDLTKYIEYDVVTVTTGSGSGTAQYRVVVENGHAVPGLDFDVYYLTDTHQLRAARFGFEGFGINASEDYGNQFSRMGRYSGKRRTSGLYRGE